MNKRLRTGLAAFISMLILILDSKTAMTGAAQGIDLCIKTIIPALFPFFILSFLLTNALANIEIPSLRRLGKLFHMPDNSESLLISAFLGGYPVGAQSIAIAYAQNRLTKQEAERLLSFCNNAGPAFLFGIVGPSFSEPYVPWLLWGIHIFSAFLVARQFQPEAGSMKISEKQLESMPEIMQRTLQSMAQVCGWVILFRVILCFLVRWILWFFPAGIQVLLAGMLELSNGCWELQSIEQTSFRFVICCAILSFGGLCVTMQTASVTKGLSLRLYLYGKIKQTLFSVLIAGAIVTQSWFLRFVICCIFLLVLSKKAKYQWKSRNHSCIIKEPFYGGFHYAVSKEN